MIILALDLAESRVGFCCGEAGSTPQADSLRLKRPKMTTDDAVAAFAKWLDGRFRSYDHFAGIDLVVCEGILPGGAAAGRTTHFVRDGQSQLQGAARAVCALRRIEIRCPALPTIRKHFCGHAWAPRPKRAVGHQRTSKEATEDRKATKAMVIQRARMLGYIDRDCGDDNAADAAAIFDYASWHFAGVSAKLGLTGAG